MTLDPVLARIDQNMPEAIDRLFDLLRIKSISTDPAFDADVDAAADWLVKDLQSLGVDPRDEMSALTVGRRCQHQAMQMLDAPTALDQLTS